jgi:phospholipid/cholesterol/gamma-HCH transport system substrate-binding protein
MPKRKYSVDFVVGIFVLIGLVCLAYLSIKLGKIEFIGSDMYPVYAEFDSVSGLKKGASVEMAGVEIGRVDGISLDPKDTAVARVELGIRPDIKLRDDVIASVRTRGIIGDKFIKLNPGGSDRFIVPGGRIRDTESSIDLEELVSKFIHGKV